jgi:F0F1-type ATP synthase assembly protein I
MNSVNNSGNNIRVDVPATSTTAATPDADTPVSNKLYQDMVTQLGASNSSLVKLGMQFTVLMAQPNMDPDTAVVILMNMIDKSGDANAKNSMEGLQADLKRSEKLNSTRMKNYSDSVKKAAEAAAKQKDQQTASDVGLGFQVAGAVFGLLGAILLTMFTLGGGAAAIVGAVIGMTTTVLDVGTRIAKATGATYDDPRDPKKKEALDITIGGAVKRAIEQAEANNAIYIPPGMDDKQKKQYLSNVTMGMTITMNLLVAATSVLCGGLSIAGAGKAVGMAKEATSLSEKVIGSAAQLFGKVANASQIVSDAGGAASMITKGAYGIQIANITFEKNELDNQKTRMDAWQSVLSNDMQSQQSYIANQFKSISSLYEDMSTLVSNYGQSQARTVRTV